MFDFDFVKMFSTTIFEIYFYHKDIQITGTNYDLYFYLIVLSPLTATLQLRNFYSFITFSLLINAVILLLNCPVLIILFYIHICSLACYFFLHRHTTCMVYSEILLTFTLFDLFRISCCSMLFPRAVVYRHL